MQVKKEDGEEQKSQAHYMIKAGLVSWRCQRALGLANPKMGEQEIERICLATSEN